MVTQLVYAARATSIMHASLHLCCCVWRTCVFASTTHLSTCETALAKYGKGQSTDDLALAVELMFERNLNRLVPQAQLVCNDFRTERLYTEEVGVYVRSVIW